MKFLKPELPDVLGLIGTGLLAWGLWMAWPPLSPIVIGLCCLALAFTTGRQ